MTSSPGLTRARREAYTQVLAPLETAISAGWYSIPQSSFRRWHTALRTSTVPTEGVYLVSLLRIASMPASLM